MIQLEELAEYIDYFYETVPNTYSNQSAIVHLEHGTWLVTIPNKEESRIRTFDTVDEVLNELKQFHFDLEILHTLIYNCVLTKATCLKLELESITELVGESAISEAEEGWRAFADKLTGIIDDVNRRKNIGLVKE